MLKLPNLRVFASSRAKIESGIRESESSQVRSTLTRWAKIGKLESWILNSGKGKATSPSRCRAKCMIAHLELFVLGNFNQALQSYQGSINNIQNYPK